MYTVCQGSRTIYFFLVFALFPIINRILANELKLFYHFVWWDEVKFLISEFFRVMWMCAYVFINYTRTYPEKMDAHYFYTYSIGEHPRFPID